MQAFNFEIERKTENRKTYSKIERIRMKTRAQYFSECRARLYQKRTKIAGNYLRAVFRLRKFHREPTQLEIKRQTHVAYWHKGINAHYYKDPCSKCPVTILAEDV